MIGMLCLIPISLIFILKNRVKKLNIVLEKIAVKRGGEVSSGTWLSRVEWPYPLLIIRHGIYTLKIHSIFGGRATPPYTYVKVKLDKAINGKIFITVKKQGLKFNFKPENEKLIAKLFTPKIQNEINTLNINNIGILIKKDEFSIQVPDIIFAEEIYNQLIDLTKNILDNFKEVNI
jgi:hypothetical protein